jgi:hypothetical protein
VRCGAGILPEEAMPVTISDEVLSTPNRNVRFSAK